MNGETRKKESPKGWREKETIPEDPEAKDDAFSENSISLLYYSCLFKLNPSIKLLTDLLYILPVTNIISNYIRSPSLVWIFWSLSDESALV